MVILLYVLVAILSMFLQLILMHAVCHTCKFVKDVQKTIESLKHQNTTIKLAILPQQNPPFTGENITEPETIGKILAAGCWMLAPLQHGDLDLVTRNK